MIYHDINESLYSFKFDNLEFYFSSKFYMNKFKREYSEFLKNETMKLKLHFKCNVYCDEMILLLLYRKIEKRGFRVYAKGLRLIDNYYIESYFDEYSYES